MTETHLTETRFSEFPLDASLLRALAEAGFERCTPIQAEALPVALAGADVAGQAQTGTGKTACFLLATFQRLLDSEAEAVDPRQPRALIMAPTRELALQILKDAHLLGKYTPFRFGIAYGGTGYQEQRDELKAGVDVLIGTPGRLIDYLKQGVYHLDRIEVVVLDEADRMFDLGFIRDIRYVLRRMPPPSRRLNMLFSATLSLRVTELAYEHMNDPKLVKIDADRSTPNRVVEHAYYPSNNEKIPLLVNLLLQPEVESALVFANMKSTVERIGRRLQRAGIRAGILSGDVPQPKRERLLQQFKDGKLRVLVATDVAARGLHIPGVSHVFNFDLPNDPEDYVHRIGRTARAGASGTAVSFACEDYAYNLVEIERFIGHPLQMEAIAPELLVEPHAERPGRGRRRGAYADDGAVDAAESVDRPDDQDTEMTNGGDAMTGVTGAEFAETVDGQASEQPEPEPAVLAVVDQPPRPDTGDLTEVLPVDNDAETSPRGRRSGERARRGRGRPAREPVGDRPPARSSRWNNPKIEIPAVG